MLFLHDDDEANLRPSQSLNPSLSGPPIAGFTDPVEPAHLPAGR
jgi:hypothetical protein